MSVGGAGLARPEVTRKFVVGLFCGGAFHDVAFTRVDGCDVVRLHDWELCMPNVARSFFPEVGAVRDMDIRILNVGVLDADIGSAVPAAGCISMRGFLARMAAKQTDDGIQRICAIMSQRSSLWCVVQRLRAKYRKVT